MSIKIFACGDIFINQKVESMADSELSGLIRSSEVAIANFEGPVRSMGKKIFKAGPHLFQDPSGLGIIKAAGFNVASLANNHIYDYGQTGLESTLEAAKTAGLNVVGAGKNFDDAYQLLIKESQGCKIGFLAYCEAEFGCL